ncbi:hypothetical protein GCM10011289_30680 [Paludibacterium paludis]|uniref:Uncharacterized protein n=1 Tax=Paludibacterium paludis TaxID=1225769 RepID=A0A918P681_9NEIS|nr:hypothetical protein GCM10011289_30680 [Paludibacterium paludis]
MRGQRREPECRMTPAAAKVERQFAGAGTDQFHHPVKIPARGVDGAGKVGMRALAEPGLDVRVV